MSILKTIYLQHLNGANANMTLDSSGNVGVGNTSPTSRLTVQCAGADGITLSRDTNDTGNSGRMFFLADGTNFAMCATANTLSFFSGSAPGNSTGTQRVLMDSSGRVTMPYQPAFYAYGGAFGPGSITFNTTDFNVGSHYSTSNGRFTAPISGIYQFGFQMFVQSTGATQCNIQKNGASVAECKINTTEGAYNSYSCNILISLAAGDYMNIGVGAGSDGKALVGHDYTFFWGRLAQ